MRISASFVALTIAVMLSAFGTTVTSAYGAARSELFHEDEKLAEMIGNIMTVKRQTDDGKADSNALDAANGKVLDYMKHICTNKSLLSYDLKRAENAGLSIATANDKKVRFYAWDTETGGTMHFYDCMAQYAPDNQSESNVLVLVPSGKPKEHDGDIESGLWYGSVDQVNTTSGKTIYLVTGYGTYSTIAHGTTIQAYTIDKGKLVAYPCFQTTKELLSEIECNSYNDPSSSPDINLSKDNKTLRVPLLLGDDHKATGKYLVYKFNGEKFVFQDAKKAAK